MTWAGLRSRLGVYVNQEFSSEKPKWGNGKHKVTTEMNKSSPLSGNKVTQFYNAVRR